MGGEARMVWEGDETLADCPCWTPTLRGLSKDIQFAMPPCHPTARLFLTLNATLDEIYLRGLVSNQTAN